MPRIIHEEAGRIYRKRTVKTFGDKVKEFLQGVAGVVLVIVIICALAS